jgi:hypothetical protein
LRGLGVAVITRTSGAAPLSRSRAPLHDAEFVLLVDDGEPEIRDARAFVQKRVRANQDVRLIRWKRG